MAMQHQDRNLQGERESLGFASHRLTSALAARTDLRANAEVLALCWKSESEVMVATRAAVYERAAGSDAVNQGREMFRPLNDTALSSSSAQALYFDEFPDRVYCSLTPRGLDIVTRGVPSNYFDVTEDGQRRSPGRIVSGCTILRLGGASRAIVYRRSHLLLLGIVRAKD
jgi:hypothetical protein